MNKIMTLLYAIYSKIVDKTKVLILNIDTNFYNHGCYKGDDYTLYGI